ncbi:MAG: O-antigen ligase family protein [Candidatus Sulfotelmatobacter sp.]
MTSQTIWQRAGAQAGTSPTNAPPAKGSDRRPLVYGALVVFAWLYYYRPEDFIPGLEYVPLAKIAGLFAVVALTFGLLSSLGKARIPRAVQFLWLLLLQMAICIPFALWRGGAFATVSDKFSKGVIVATLISMAVVTVKELRRLLWIQVSAVAFVVFFSIVFRHYQDGRLLGIQKGILENPNDLAINVAISFPLGVAFMLRASGFRKALWALGLAGMALGVVLTYSRAGLLAFLISMMVCVWEYGIKGGRRYLIGVAAAILLIGAGIVAANSHYRARVESIILGNIEGAEDHGSFDARKELLEKSIVVAMTHPLVGVGPGCFVLVDKGWVVAHNSYTELAAEAGFPALFLFLLALGAAFGNLRRVRKSSNYEQDPEFRLFTQALWVGLVAYLIGACFDSTEYNLYPYFMVGYTCAMVRIAGPLLAGSHQNSTAGYANFSRTQSVWNR